MEKNIKKTDRKYFVLDKNIPFLPIPFQFIQGTRFEKSKGVNNVSQRIEVEAYSTDMFMPYSHYKPISKIIDLI